MLTIAYLGPEKTNTHFAALKRFGKRANYLHAPTVDDVFHAVERRKAEYGVVPVENSLEGAVTHTLDRFIDFLDTPVKIHGEVERLIRHYLIVYRGAKLGKLEMLYSHPQALAQCRQWLDHQLPGVHRVETNSTAEAVQKLLEKHGVTLRSRLRRPALVETTPQFFADAVRPSHRAAIARAELGHTRKLQAIPIPEQRENKTRFLILGLGELGRSRRNKTSILLALNDRPGALHDSLMPFKRQGINLTKIESRPSKKKAWEYLFFIDFEGHVAEPRVTRALKALERSTSLLRVLGSYPLGRSSAE